jgi:pimeloyl-ACP methyl ester carboxylesterase
LLIWGAEDRILPRSYAQRFIAGIKGPTELKVIAGAGHLAELDKPDDTAAAILDWTR